MTGISEIYPSDRRSLAEVDALLAAEGIRRDPHLDYICALRDDGGTIIATGSAYKSTLRCFAVSDAHQGEGLLGTVLSHLMEHELLRGYASVSLYTKPKSAKFFGDLGFYEIASVDGLVFMENEREGFASCLARFERETAAFCAEKGMERPAADETAAIVMNANPFTLGHRALVERAAREIYLRGFEIAVRRAQPLALMTSYNLVAGTHMANRCDLLTDVLRKEWGFRGMIMTDWGTTGGLEMEPGKAFKYGTSDPAQCMHAGNDLIMPGKQADVDAIIDAVHNGSLDEQELRACAARILKTVLIADSER